MIISIDQNDKVDDDNDVNDYTDDDDDDEDDDDDDAPESDGGTLVVVGYSVIRTRNRLNESFRSTL